MDGVDHIYLCLFNNTDTIHELPTTMRAVDRSISRDKFWYAINLSGDLSAWLSPVAHLNAWASTAAESRTFCIQYITETSVLPAPTA